MISFTEHLPIAEAFEGSKQKEPAGKKPVGKAKPKAKPAPKVPSGPPTPSPQLFIKRPRSTGIGQVFFCPCPLEILLNLKCSMCSPRDVTWHATWNGLHTSRGKGKRGSCRRDCVSRQQSISSITLWTATTRRNCSSLRWSTSLSHQLKGASAWKQRQRQSSRTPNTESQTSAPKHFNGSIPSTVVSSVYYLWTLVNFV